MLSAWCRPGAAPATLSEPSHFATSEAKRDVSWSASAWQVVEKCWRPASASTIIYVWLHTCCKATQFLHQFPIISIWFTSTMFVAALMISWCRNRRVIERWRLYVSVIFSCVPVASEPGKVIATSCWCSWHWMIHSRESIPCLSNMFAPVEQRRISKSKRAFHSGLHQSRIWF